MGVFGRGGFWPEVWGEPVYRHAKALDGPRYMPEPGLGARLRAHVAAIGADFFMRPAWRDELFVGGPSIIHDLRYHNSNG